MNYMERVKVLFVLHLNHMQTSLHKAAKETHFLVTQNQTNKQTLLKI